MKKLKYLSSVIFVLLSVIVCAQKDNTDCQDVVYLKGGSVFRGEILEYKVGGELKMKTWNGVPIQVPALNVKRIVQKCKSAKRGGISLNKKPYSFKDSGWYHASRISVLTGASGVGASIQHSSGIKLNRLLGIGIGLGMENFKPYDGHAPTFPIFVELRGYLLQKNISPFYSLGLGYGFTGKRRNFVIFDGPDEHWKGGWMAQGHIGYRIGKHAFVQLGIRLQRKTRIWEQFGWDNLSGVDRILHKRLDIGLGLIL